MRLLQPISQRCGSNRAPDPDARQLPEDQPDGTPVGPPLVAAPIRNDALSTSWPGLARPSTSCLRQGSKTWMPGTRPGMTSRESCVLVEQPRSAAVLPDRVLGDAVGFGRGNRHAVLARLAVLRRLVQHLGRETDLAKLFQERVGIELFH